MNINTLLYWESILGYFPTKTLILKTISEKKRHKKKHKKISL